MTTGDRMLDTAVGFASGLDLLADAPSATAIVTDEETITYAELGARMARRADQLGGGRRLVLIEAENALEPLVTYLAASAAGHVVLLVPAESATSVLARYDPDVLVSAGAAEPEHREGSPSRRGSHPARHT